MLSIGDTISPRMTYNRTLTKAKMEGGRIALIVRKIWSASRMRTKRLYRKAEIGAGLRNVSAIIVAMLFT